MIKSLFIISSAIFLLIGGSSKSFAYESIDLLNSRNIERYFNDDLGYSAPETFPKRAELINDVADLLTSSGPDDFESCVDRNKNFTLYRNINRLIETEGGFHPQGLSQRSIAAYKLFYNFEMSEEELSLIDQKTQDAVEMVESGHYPFFGRAREKAISKYQSIEAEAITVGNLAFLYSQIKEGWEFWGNLRAKLNEDFSNMRVFSHENRKSIVANWLTARIENRYAEIPTAVTKLEKSGFSTFFAQEEENPLFTEREKEAMRKVLEQAIQSELPSVTLHSVDSLNIFNFGLLLDDMLGHLYKSHGCLHVSPRNSHLLYRMLPVGAKITIYPYTKPFNEKDYESVPYLTDLVNFTSDLSSLESEFKSKNDVAITVYPESGFWIIYLKRKPFAKLHVLGGPKKKMYIVEGYDSKGNPIFEKTAAFPTPPGMFFIFRKIRNYSSNLYRNLTAIPQGGVIKKEGKRWIYENRAGNWVNVPKIIRDDIIQSAEKRNYSFYDVVKNTSGETIEAKWGSHPFGTYALIISRDMRTPSPELIHSSGDLIMERRQIIRDLIKVLSAPEDELDQCIRHNDNFYTYKGYYDFTKNPTGPTEIDKKAAAYYRLYDNLPLTSSDTALIRPIAIKAKEALKMPPGPDYERMLGINFDTYQYYVAIKKYANHYAVLKDNWERLKPLRQAILNDFKQFVIKDPVILTNYLKELMLQRTNLERLDQKESLKLLYDLLQLKNE